MRSPSEFEVSEFSHMRRYLLILICRKQLITGANEDKLRNDNGLAKEWSTK